MEEASVEVAFSLHYLKQKCAIHRCCMLFTVHKNEEQLYESLPILVAGWSFLLKQNTLSDQTVLEITRICHVY